MCPGNVPLLQNWIYAHRPICNGYCGLTFDLKRELRNGGIAAQGLRCERGQVLSRTPTRERFPRCGRSHVVHPAGYYALLQSGLWQGYGSKLHPTFGSVPGLCWQINRDSAGECIPRVPNVVCNQPQNELLEEVRAENLQGDIVSLSKSRKLTCSIHAKSVTQTITDSGSLLKPHDAQLRQKQYPTGCGKAYDVALLCKWLGDKLSEMEAQDPASRLPVGIAVCDSNTIEVWFDIALASIGSTGVFFT